MMTVGKEVTRRRWEEVREKVAISRGNDRDEGMKAGSVSLVPEKGLEYGTLEGKPRIKC